MKKLLLTAFAASLGLMAVNAAVIDVTGDITVSTQWTADNEYILNTVVYIRDGATLSIEPGTVIRGLAEDSGSSGNTTALWVCRGGKLIAKGTAEKPIIMTDEWDNNFPWVDPADFEWGYETINPNVDMPTKSKQWGGLVMCGRAYITDQTVSTPTSHPRILESAAEGINPDAQGSTLYGGSDDDDCSGVLSYVSVRYGGYKLEEASEVNGITLCGVGRSTQIDHVEVIGNQDDGIEFFGGTVDTKYVNISIIGDDSFDVDQGYRGRCQFLFIMQGFCNTEDGKFGGGWGNHAFEMDGAEDYNENQPWGMQRYENVTIIGMNTQGKGTDPDYLDPKDDNSHAMQLDDNVRAQFFNVIATDIQSYFAVVEDSAGAVDSAEGLTTLATAGNLPAVQNVGADVATYAPYYYRSQNTNYNQTCFQNFVLYNCYDDGLAAKSDSSNVPQSLIDTSSWNWNVASSLPIRYMEREVVSTDRPIPSGYIGDPNVKLIDPRPVAAWTSSPYTPPADGFATPVNYYGAFAPSGPTWLDGWSALSTSGMLTNVVDETSAVALDSAGFTVSAQDVIVGVEYKLQEAADVAGPWSDVPGAVARAASTSISLTDFGVAGESTKFYQVITAD
ncbi:MAG: hypothetical protein R6V06_02735 [Kiritimatiellia bacterium]